MVEINALEWGATSSKNNKYNEYSFRLMSEYSLRYSTKNGKENLDLVGYGISGHLKLKNFNNLFSLDCSSNEKIDDKTLSRMSVGSNNNITSLDLSDCKSLRSINCSGNDELIKLDISNCKYLEDINLVGCLKLKTFIFDSNIHSESELIKKTKMSFCKDFSCKKSVDNEKYCKDHVDKYRTHSCKYEGCNLLINISKEYCKNHVLLCSIDNCLNRMDRYQKYCDYHQNKVKLEKLLTIKKRHLETKESDIESKNSELSSTLDLIKRKLISKSIFSSKKQKREQIYLLSFENFLEYQELSYIEKNNYDYVEKFRKSRELLKRKISDNELDAIIKIYGMISYLKLEKQSLEVECRELVISVNN
ncbi:MAG: hypothetical protein AD073_000246 [Mycoplasmataceae bacterium]|nr:MAG: hypothetical protein AD073_000246 [Mycoplasmataceae bacterium]